MQDRPAAPSHLVFPAGQPGQEFADPLLHRRPAPQAQIASGLLSGPASDSLIGVEVRAVARQVHQPQLQLRRPEVLPHRFPTVGRRIVPDDPQRPWMLFLQLRPVASGRQPRSRCCCYPPVPSIPPRPSPGTPLNSSWPSPHTAGWSTPPEPGPLSAPTCPAIRHLPCNRRR